MPDTKPNVGRKADRDKVASRLTTIGEAAGATVERRDEPRSPGISGPSVVLTFRLNGVGATVDIDDLLGANYGLLSWFNDYSGGRNTTGHFTPGFQAAVGDDVKGLQRSHHKATSQGSWAQIEAHLQAGLRHAINGTAFLAAAA